MPILGYSAALEQFHPTDLIRWCQEAEQAGFDRVIPRSAFTNHLPEILTGKND